MFALYGDIVVLSEEGVYSAVFMKYGFTPGMGATYILKEKLGHNLATEMMLTARNYTGEHLKQRGTSTIIVKQKDVLNEALSIAQSIAEKPIVSIKLLKKDFADKALKSLMKYINEEVKMHDITFVTPEVKEKINYYYGNGRKKQIDSSEKKY
jgi:enoyl-CoA hydratase/carnithine racemase